MSKINGHKIGELRRLNDIIIMLDGFLKAFGLKVMSSFIYKEDGKTKIRIEITEMRRRK